MGGTRQRSANADTRETEKPFAAYDELVIGSVGFRWLDDAGLVGRRASRHRRGFYATRGKRLLDIIVATGLLVLLWPIIVIAALVLWCTNGRPILFSQIRVGYRERSFRIRKFRTMTDDRDLEGRLLPDERRLTRVGEYLRRLSIDELPQLINVVRGDMSLIGPRPLLLRYLPRYGPRQRRRHLVRPGIVGLAQVLGRDGRTWAQRLEADACYANGPTFLLDAAIVALSVGELWRRLILRRHAAPDLEEFWGRERPAAGAPRRHSTDEDGR